jgi:hypothetical protein
LICHGVPINRIGVYKYLGVEIGKARDTDKEFSVMRRSEDVFDAAAMASFEGKAVTDGHPPDDVTPDNIHIYGKGHVENVRKGTGKDEGCTVADLYITDPDLIEDIQSKRAREVSCGYNYELFENPNGSLEQRAIRGNHVAVVKSGRAGSRVAIKDANPETPQSERRTDPMGNIRGKLLKIFARDEDTTPEEVEQAAMELGPRSNAVKDADPVAAPPTPAPAPAPATPVAPAPPAEDNEPNPLLAKLDELIGLMKPIADAIMNDGAPAQDEEPDELEALAAGAETPEAPEDGQFERIPGEEEDESQAQDDGDGIQGEGAAFDPVDNADSVTVDPEAIQNARDQAAIAARIARDALSKVITDPVALKQAAKDTAAMIRKQYGLDSSASAAGYAGVFAATKQSANESAGKARDSINAQRKAADDAQKAYDARNPHKKKEDK